MRSDQCFIISLSGILALCLLHMEVAHGKPIAEPEYSEDESSYDTEEIFNQWDKENEDDSMYLDESDERSVPVVKSLPPILVEYVAPTTLPTTTSTTTTPTTTRKPVYFPRSEIELGSLFEAVGKARRNEVEGPVDLPVPYIVWTKDPTGQEDKVNYWQKFYNTMYKVD